MHSKYGAGHQLADNPAEHVVVQQAAPPPAFTAGGAWMLVGRPCGQKLYTVAPSAFIGFEHMGSPV